MKIYLACPYTNFRKKTERYRHVVANEVAATLISKGYLVYSPISHTHPIHEACDGKITHDQWLHLDSSFLEWADEVWVITLDGWDKSKGVAFEMALAEKLGKPVRLIGADDVSSIPGLD